MKDLSKYEQQVLAEAARILEGVHGTFSPKIQRILRKEHSVPVKGSGRDLWSAHVDGVGKVYILADSREVALGVARKHFGVGTNDLWNPKIGLFLKARG